jgi:hypothetical protein
MPQPTHRVRPIETLFNDPFVKFTPAARCVMTYVRRTTMTLVRLLSIADAGFAKAVGFSVLLGLLWDWWAGPTWAGRLRFPIEIGAAWLGAAIFIAWTLRILSDTHTVLALEGNVMALLTTLWGILENGGHRDGKHRTQRQVIPFDRIPPKLTKLLIESMAQLAYNRWTHNATFEDRLRFFTHLAKRYPQGIRVGIEYDEQQGTLSLYGYACLVPLGIPSYRKHLLGEANLFEQEGDFILSAAEVEVRTNEYRSPGTLDKERDGLAVYILGMNVRAGAEHTHSNDMLRALTRQIRGLLRQFPREEPYLYCATNIPSVMKKILSYGFRYRGHRDQQGNKLYERELHVTPALEQPNCHSPAT